MERCGAGNGIWVTYIEGLQEGDIYKYAVTTASGEVLMKSDPYAFWSEVRPNTASKITKLRYTWKDKKWRPVFRQPAATRLHKRPSTTVLSDLDTPMDWARRQAHQA